MKKQLIFETLEEFQLYVAEHNIKLSSLEIYECNESDKIIESKETIEVVVENPVQNIIDVQLISLHDNPTIKAIVSENNVLYVKDIQMNENSCMPAVLDILGRKVSVILCNENGKTHANLSVALDNKPKYNVVFEVRKLEGEETTMEIANTLLETKK